MKVLLLFAAIISLGASSAFAQAHMLIHKTDGTQERFLIDSVQRLSFFNANGPEHWWMKVKQHWNEQPPWHGMYQVSEHLKPFFQISSEGERILRFSAFEGFRVLTEPKPTEEWEAPVDNISFLRFSRDTAIIQFSGSLPGATSGPRQVAEWRNQNIFAAGPLIRIGVRDDLDFEDSGEVLVNSHCIFMAANRDGTRLLFVRSKFFHVSIGSLFEYDIASKTVRAIDTSRQISSAVYSPDGSHIYYYAYGSYDRDSNNLPADAGYYRCNLDGTGCELILQHISNLGPGEGVNGFDIHPDERSLLLPFVHGDRAPVLATLDLMTLGLDTLDVQFDASGGRFCLWVRYDSSGSRFVYANYPLAVVGEGYTGVESEVGIFDVTTGDRQVLEIVPDDMVRWVVLFPNWSPDGRSLVFTASPISIEPPGYVGNYGLYILKRIQ